MSETLPPVVTPLTGEDTEAPYGRKADGTPRQAPGRKPGQRTGTGTTRRRRQPDRVDYKTPILGLFQLPAGVLAIAGMQRPVFAADAAAITVHAPNIAQALDDLAHERPEVAAVLDRVLQVGPYGVLIAAVVPLALQVLANHEALPAGALGTIPREQLIASFVPPETRERMAQMAAENGQRPATEGAPDGANPPE